MNAKQDAKNKREKGTLQRVYFTGQDCDRIKRESEKLGIPQQILIQQIVHAGLVAIEKNGDRLTLPVNFHLDSEKHS